MKKLIKSIGFMAFAGLSLVSCSSDDDAAPFGFTESDLYGRWDFSRESFTINGQSTPEADYSENETGCNKDYINFTTGGAGIDGDYYGDDCTFEGSDFTWTKTGNTITVDYGDDVFTYNVISLDATNLVIQTTETGGGITVVSTYKLIK